jgi:multicomponent Na+:H+ antiporter subunit D
MSSPTLPYLLLFLPLIASVFCFLVNFKKSDFLIFISISSILLIITIRLGFNFFVNGEIKSDSTEILSIPTEYRLDYLAIFFLLLILSSQILIAFLYRFDLSKALNKDNRQLFYSVWLLNIFGAIGIFATNNIFNLFVFIEIYCLTFCAIITMSNDLALSKSAFKYFCNSASGAILMLLALILIHASCEFLQIDKIDNSLFASDLVSWFVVIAVILKFFPINLYFNILKSRDPLSTILLSFALVTNGVIGFYLLLRILLLLFEGNQIFFWFAPAVGFMLIFYSNYKMLRTKYLKVFALYFVLTNLGFVLITFLVNKSSFASLLYIVNYVLSGLALFCVAKYLANNQKSLQIRLSKHNFGWQNKIIILVIILIISNLPFTLIFWANWNLALLSFDSKIFSLLIVLPIISTNIALAKFQLSCFERAYINSYPKF